jgi:hypothetical protein
LATRRRENHKKESHHLSTRFGEKKRKNARELSDFRVSGPALRWAAGAGPKCNSVYDFSSGFVMVTAANRRVS